jgi:hypothetical protein
MIIKKQFENDIWQNHNQACRCELLADNCRPKAMAWSRTSVEYTFYKPNELKWHNDERGVSSVNWYIIFLLLSYRYNNVLWLIEFISITFHLVICRCIHEHNTININPCKYIATSKAVMAYAALLLLFRYTHTHNFFSILAAGNPILCLKFKLDYWHKYFLAWVRRIIMLCWNTNMTRTAFRFYWMV